MCRQIIVGYEVLEKKNYVEKLFCKNLFKLFYVGKQLVEVHEWSMLIKSSLFFYK